MELVTKRVRIPSRAAHLRLTPLGDIHLGAAGCDESALKAIVAEIADDPFHYTIYMGDMIDAILPDDKRWDEKAVPRWLRRGAAAMDEFERAREILSPIPADRVLGILEGNHEIVTRARHYVDVTLDLARTLKIPYLGQEAIVRLLTQRGEAIQSFDIFVTKLAADGSAVLWSTFLGDTGDDRGWAIQLDAADQPVVAGITASTGFPVTAAAFDRTHNGSYDAFAAKLTGDGRALVWSPFYGGSDSEWDVSGFGPRRPAATGDHRKLAVAAGTGSASVGVAAWIASSSGRAPQSVRFMTMLQGGESRRIRCGRGTGGPI